MSKISVIITTYNRADMLKKAIQSVLNQNYGDYELLILDNDSTDNTERVVKNFMESGKIKYIKHKQLNISQARNLGIEKSTGEYIAFLDDDDEWLPNKLASQISVFNAGDGRAALVYGAFALADEAGKISMIHKPRLKGQILEHLLLQRDPFTGSASNPMIKKDVFNSIGKYNEKVLTGEDLELYLRIAAEFNIEFTNELVVKISQHRGNRLGNKLEDAAALELLLLEKYKSIIERKPSLKSNYFQKIGGKLLRAGRFKEGRGFIIQAIKTSPFNIIAYMQYVSSLLSPAAYFSLHKAYRTCSRGLQGHFKKQDTKFGAARIVKLLKRAGERIATITKAMLLYRNFHVYLINRLGFYKGDKLILSLHNGISYIIRNKKISSADYYVINETWVHGIHDAASKIIRNNSVVIDIGAHIGAFSVFAASQANNVRVYSFEPIPDNFELLQQNIELNKFKNNITPVPKGVWSCSGKKSIYLSLKDSGLHSFFDKRLKEYEPELKHDCRQIECVCLKDIFDTYKIEVCDFLKIDCEGSEYEILFSTPEEYLKKIGFISLEYHDNETHDINELMEFLKKHGFNISRPFADFGIIYARNFIHMSK
jgi:FkbM family methyltransferase